MTKGDFVHDLVARLRIDDLMRKRLEVYLRSAPHSDASREAWQVLREIAHVPVSMTRADAEDAGWRMGLKLHPAREAARTARLRANL